jgi:YD repeat-containing protein
VSLDSFTQITASFASNTVPAGTYSVMASQGTNTAVLTNALTIAAAGAPQLATKLILPSFLGRHIAATLYVEYANTGNAPMPAPLLVLQGTGPTPAIRPVITLDSSRIVQNFWSSVPPPGTGNKVYILGSGAQAGVLNPGERIRVPVYYLGLQQPWDFTQNSVTMGIRFWTADNTNSIDWSTREASFRPPTLDSNTWDIIYQNITANLTNNGAYVRMLDNAAQYLSRLGERVTDVGRLWNFAVQQAMGFQAVPVLDSAVDAFLPTPGVALEFDRHFSSSVAARNTMGPFGAGWFTPWQTMLTVQSNGAVVELIGEGGSVRVYTRDARNGGYFSGPGDSSTLTGVGNGVYELSDPNGIVTRFRADGRIDYTTDPNGNTVTAGYDGLGRLTSLAHTSGAALSFGYNAAGLMAKAGDSAGRSVTYGYDATANHLLTATTDDGKATV